MAKLEVGMKVRAPGYGAPWNGVGTITESGEDDGIWLVDFNGEEGGFAPDELEPVAETAPAPARKFKVGDRVHELSELEPANGTVIDVDASGGIRLTWHFPAGDCKGSMFWPADDFELVEPAPRTDADNKPDAVLTTKITVDFSGFDVELDRVFKRLRKLKKKARKLGISLDAGQLQAV